RGGHAADDSRLLARLAGGRLETSSALVGAGAADPGSEPVGELRALLERAQGGPESRLHRLFLGFERTVGAVGVADPAAEADQVRILQLPENPAARRTPERRMPAQRL